jgi:hypothetical protein
MAKSFIATQKIFVGTALAYNVGDPVDADAVSRNKWDAYVAREDTKAANDAIDQATDADVPAQGISDQVV